jgi:hypothetical protein
MRTTAHAPRAFRTLPALAALASCAFVPAVTPGCGNVTSGGVGEVEVLLSSDVVDDAAALAAAIESEALTGTMRVTLRSFVWDGEGELGDGRGEAGWVELTAGPQEVEVALEDPAPVEVARATLPAGEYRAVRTVFGRVRVNVEGGLTVEGEEITGEIEVAIGSEGLFVVEEWGVTVREGDALPLLLEMGVRAWIGRLDRATRSVDGEELEREFRVRVGPAG